MPGATERSTLHVEGQDDQHSIMHLLIRHGMGYDREPWPMGLPKVRPAGGISQLLTSIETAVRLAGPGAVGFVLDADSPLADRWQAVCTHLRKAGVAPPGAPPGDGLIDTSSLYQSRVGVWLMPDNRHDGKLESFLQTLIDEHDLLLAHATAATDQAKANKGAKFADTDRPKAVIHAWLAWQQEPGLPYGTAIRARYFQHESPAAIAFVRWFRELYRVA